MNAEVLVIHCPAHGDVARFIEHLATRSEIELAAGRHILAYHRGDATD
jgi:hypothetical protein